MRGWRLRPVFTAWLQHRSALLWLFLWLGPAILASDAVGRGAGAMAATPTESPAVSGSGSTAPAAAESNRPAIVLHIDGVIGPASADYLTRGLKAAIDRPAAFVVLRMNTPGGLDSSMRAIIRDILASPIPVVTYVSPSGARAASAGTYILYASHLAAMAPGTNVGAATPVALGGTPDQPSGQPPKRPDDGDSKDGDAKTKESAPPRPASAMEAKAINDAVAYLQSLAELRGRNAEWAEKAVREAASLPAHEALEQNVIEIIARDLDDLLTKANGRVVRLGETEITLKTRDIPVEHLEPDWRTRFLAVITDPNVALILMMIGIYGLIFEFMTPGVFFPGTIGAICLLLGLYALAALPVNYAGLALIALGVAFMAAEAFTPSFGALGIGGAIAFALGATILIDADMPGFAISWPVIVGIAATSLAFSLLVVRMALSARHHQIVAGREQMIGAPAQVLQWDDGTGYVLAHGERWRAVSNAPLTPGQYVRVKTLDGLTLTVEPEHP